MAPESGAHDAIGQAQLTARGGHGHGPTVDASHLEVKDPHLLGRGGTGGGDASHHVPHLVAERADNHRHGEPAIADPAGVRAASPGRGDNEEQ